MSRFIMIRRLRGPAFLLLVGVNALLAQAHILGWGKSWPFYLILAGVLLLAERAALAAEGGTPYPGSPYGGSPYEGAPDPRAATGIPPYPGQPSAIIPTGSETYAHPFEKKDPNGGQS